MAFCLLRLFPLQALLQASRPAANPNAQFGLILDQWQGDRVFWLTSAPCPIRARRRKLSLQEPHLAWVAAGALSVANQRAESTAAVVQLFVGSLDRVRYDGSGRRARDRKRRERDRDSQLGEEIGKDAGQEWV